MTVCLRKTGGTVTTSGVLAARPNNIFRVRTPKTHADLAQLAEQLFRKQQVAGSSPAVGSMENPVVATKSGPSA